MSRVALALALALAGCAGDDGPVAVFAAASTSDVVHGAAEAETAAGRPTIVSVAASSVLARQIARGAPADVVVSADPAWLDWLEAEGVTLADRRVVARGRLVVVGPADARAVGGVAEALAGAERVALADPAHVPAGRYARSALVRLALWASVEPRVVVVGDVRAAVAAVETGAADRAVVYASDARASARVRVLARVPPAAQPEIAFEAALLDAPRGRAAFDAVASPAAAERWRAAGFDPVSP